MNIADLLIKTIEANTKFDQGDGGYDFKSKRRDITFHHPDGRYFEITIGDVHKETREDEDETSLLNTLLAELKELNQKAGYEVA
tara:strand:+ start:216 stop:467 length:252 start_codon:yes stop_codon:yes gene_type:complete